MAFAGTPGFEDDEPPPGGTKNANGQNGHRAGSAKEGPDSQRAEPDLGFALTDWTAEVTFAGEAEPIQWLVSGAIPRGVVGLVAAAGDVGKSYLLLELGIRVAWDSGDLIATPIFGGSVMAHGAVVFVTAEDSKASVHRRLRALDPDGQRLARAKSRGKAYPLYIIPLPDAGGPFPIVEDGRAGIGATKQYQALRTQLLAIPNLRFVVLDPLQAFVLADVNADPMAAQLTCSLLARLAAETSATVLVAHHVRKAAEPPRTPEEARAAIRGTTALVDGVRVAVALWQPAEAEARKACRALGVEHRPARVAYAAVVKSNDGANRKVWTMVRNDAGLLIDRTGDIAVRTTRPDDLLKLLEEGIARAAEEGRPFAKMGESGVHKRRAELGEELAGVGRDRLETMVDDLEQAGRVMRSLATGTTVKWLDVPDGPFARGEGQFVAGARNGKRGPRGSQGGSDAG